VNVERGVTVWMTGLPASGKTTIARLVEDRLRDAGRLVEVLDGDEVRKGLSSDLGFSKEDREQHAMRVTYVAKVLTRNGVVVIVCLISPFREFRRRAREEIGDFIEVFVHAEVEECIKRDPKGLYRKALAGEIKDMTGIQDPYEQPVHPELVIDTHTTSPERGADMILHVMEWCGYL
jgi:adenylyl-sulfate kinase